MPPSPYTGKSDIYSGKLSSPTLTSRHTLQSKIRQL